MNKSDMQKTNIFLILNLFLIFTHIFMERYVFMKQLKHGWIVIICLFIIFIFAFLLCTWDILPNEWLYDKPTEASHIYSVSKQTDIIISKDCKKVHPYCYAGNKSITSVRFESIDTEIEAKAFFDCTKLSCIRLPENLTEISPFTFAFCEGLKEIHIPKNVKEIKEGAFCACKELKKIVFLGIPSAKGINETAFLGCTGVKFLDSSYNPLEKETLSKIIGTDNLSKLEWLDDSQKSS